MSSRLLLVAGSAIGLLVGFAQAQADSPDGDMPLEVRYLDARLIESPPPAVLGPTFGRGTNAQFVFTGDLPEGDAPSSVVFTSDGQTIVISHRESRNLILWDAATRAFIGEVPVSGAAQSVALTPDDTMAVVANVDNDTISIVDMTTLTETAVLSAAENPGVVKISPAGDLAAVSLAASGEMAIVDIAGGTIVRTIAGLGYGGTLSFSFEPPATSLQYSEFYFVDDDRVANMDGFANEVQIINVRTGAVTRIPVAVNGRGFAISLDGSVAAVAHWGATRLITVIDLTTETVSSTIPAPVDLFVWDALALNTDGSKAVVGVQNAARVVDLTTGVFGPSLNTASINRFRTTFDGQYALGVGYRGALIEFSTGNLVAQLNNVVSTEIGAVSPVDHRAAMCSTTFGDDLVVVSTNGSAGSLEAFQLSGPWVEGDRCRTIAISSDGSTAAGVSIFSDSLSVIDTATGTVTGTAQLGQRPHAIAITPDGTKAVVGNLDDSFATVVDLATATSTNINISRRAGAVEISPDGQYAYIGVVASGDGVWRIDLTTNTVAGARLFTGNMGGVGYSYSQTSGMDLSSDGSLLAVAGSFTDNVTFIDTGSWTVLTNVSVPAGSFPAVVEFSNDGSTLLVANRNTDTVSVIDTSGPVPMLTSTFAVGDSPWHIVDAGGGFAWVNNWGDSVVALYNTTTGASVASFALTDRAVGLHLDADNQLLYAANGNASTTLGGTVGWAHTEDGRITVIDTASMTIAEMIPLGVAPSMMAMNPASTVAAMSAPQADGAVVVNLGGPCNEADFAEPYGTLDFFDVQAFLNAFSAMDPASDINNDGLFDFFDVQAFLNAFSAGCP